MKYIIFNNSPNDVKVLKLLGYESGIPCYESYLSCPDFPVAVKLIQRLETA